MTKKYAYFPGCSAASTGISFTLSSNFVAGRIGLQMVEIPDWSCCGTTAALVTDRHLAVALSARSMALSEKSNPGLDVVSPCAGCYNSLKNAVHFARISEENRKLVEALIDMPYAATADVYSFLEIMSLPENKTAIENALTTSLHGLKVACYYGCALVRPPKVCQFDDPEYPQSMDTLMRLVGAEPIDWGFKVECCGASHQISEPKASRPLIENIFQDAAINGAEAIITACPLCDLNLDLREKEINASRAAAGKSTFDIPVYYFTELLGLAMGGTPKQLGIDRHFWPTDKSLQKATTKSPTQPPEPPTQQAPTQQPTQSSATPAEGVNP